jgi:type IV fimbrial biogenesis protein FimT
VRVSPKRHRNGFTLIELMIALAIFGLLLMLAAPAYTRFLANTQVRTAAETIMNGVRTAQTEAIKRNAQVAFVLDDAVGWTIQLVEDGSTLATYNFNEGAGHASVSHTPAGATRTTFTGLGRVMTANPDATEEIYQIDVTTTTVSSPKNMRVVIGVPGSPINFLGSKLCDPSFPSTDPVGCP